MRTRWLATTALLVLPLVLAVGQQQLQQQPPRWSGRVEVAVSGDEPVVTSVKSYVAREARAVGDVVMTDNEPECHLSIIVSTTSGGHAISVTTYKELKSSTVKWLLEKREIKPEVIADLVPHLAGYSFDIRQWLLTCPPSGLETAIRQGVIAKFDIDILQPLRDSFQKNSDELNRFILLWKKDQNK